jgi:hypothetical protein
MRRDTKRTMDGSGDTTATLERRVQQEGTDSSPEYGTELTHERRCDGDAQRTRGRGSRSGGGH